MALSWAALWWKEHRYFWRALGALQSLLPEPVGNIAINESINKPSMQKFKDRKSGLEGRDLSKVLVQQA